MLEKCTIELHAYTYIQAIRNELLRSGDEQRDWKETHRIASCDFSDRMNEAPPVGELMDLNELMQIGVPRNHKPGFSTCNIGRSYKLGVNLTVERAQKTFKKEFMSRGDFVLLAAECVQF